MEKTHTTKQIIIIVLIVIVIGAIVLGLKSKKERVVTSDNRDTNKEEQNPVNLCYYVGDKTMSGFYNVTWLKLNILGDKITGEFQNLPAESDSKVGTFEETTLSVDPNIIGRRSATVWWNSRAEGMEVKEELDIMFGEGSATVGFGKMIDRGDGVYVYEDKRDLYYVKSIDQIDCEVLDEKLFAEKYIRDNIKTIATDKPVLGGSWYVISLAVDSVTHTGEIVYEDGHVQSKASFKYTYNKDPQSILITEWKVK